MMEDENNKQTNSQKMKFFFELGNYVIIQILRNLRLSSKRKNLEEKLNNSLRTISETYAVIKLSKDHRRRRRRRRRESKKKKFCRLTSLTHCFLKRKEKFYHILLVSSFIIAISKIIIKRPTTAKIGTEILTTTRTQRQRELNLAIEYSETYGEQRQTHPKSD